jgi:CheY-like chemotaxis protein
MDGWIQAGSAPGEGLTVTFETTLFHVQNGVDAAPEPQAPASSLRPLHVLIADDNATNRLVAETLCAMFDCTSYCVEDGAQAVEAARSGRFDLILMDIKMPVMDGLQAVERIRALDGPVSRTPVLALTANADPWDAIDYIASGMDGVVEKPIKPDALFMAMVQATAPRAPQQAAVAVA